MCLHSLLPDPDRLHLLSLAADGAEITLTARTCSDVACCPVCGQPSSRVHSRYRRILANLPWQGISARLLLWTRRFFCDAPDCVRRIFTERLPGVAIPYAHRTDRLRDWVTHVSFALGGEAGCRLLRALGVPVSGDTLLAHIRAAVIQASAAPRVLSVDDFAVRRGRTYGSILVDLESHRVVRVPSGWHLAGSERPHLRGMAHDTSRRGDHQPRPGWRVRGGSPARCPCRHPGGRPFPSPARAPSGQHARRCAAHLQAACEAYRPGRPPHCGAPVAHPIAPRPRRVAGTDTSGDGRPLQRDPVTRGTGDEPLGDCPCARPPPPYGAEVLHACGRPRAAPHDAEDERAHAIRRVSARTVAGRLPQREATVAGGRGPGLPGRLSRRGAPGSRAPFGQHTRPGSGGRTVTACADRLYPGGRDGHRGDAPGEAQRA